MKLIAQESCIVSFYSLLPGFFELVQQFSEAAAFKALMMCSRSTDSHDVICPVFLRDRNKAEATRF